MKISWQEILARNGLCSYILPPVVEQLRVLGNDVLTIQETGKADPALPDDAVLKFAVAAREKIKWL